jgi:hypothetical protein
LDAVLAPLFKPRERRQNPTSSLDLWKQDMQASNFGPGKSRGFINSILERQLPEQNGEGIKPLYNLDRTKGLHSGAKK